MECEDNFFNPRIKIYDLKNIFLLVSKNGPFRISLIILFFRFDVFQKNLLIGVFKYLV